MKVRLLTYENAGQAVDVEVGEGTTLRMLCEMKLARKPVESNYVVRVNTFDRPWDYVLTDGAFVSATPQKLTGAA